MVISCPLCESADAIRSFEKAGLTHYQCPECGSLFVAPPPSAATLEAFYSDACHTGSALCWAGTRRHLRDTWAEALDRARRLGGKGGLLDVGCGAGQFLAFAKEQGVIELVGLETNAEAATAAARTGARIVTATLQRADLAEGSFAQVSMWDVFEHLADPATALSRVRRLLRPGGVLLLSAPHRGGLALRLLGRRAETVCPPEHLLYPTRAGLRCALERAGFAIRSLRVLDIYLREWTRFLPAARGRAGDAETYQRWYARLTGSTALVNVRRATNLLLDVSGLGDQLVAVAQRQ